MKGKNNAGFSMVEVLVAIAILAGIVIPVCSSLVLSLRINAKAEMMLQARIAVSSAVETLMAEGISDENVDDVVGDYPVNVSYDLDEESGCYEVTVTSNVESVAITTYIRSTEEEGDQ